MEFYRGRGIRNPRNTSKKFLGLELWGQFSIAVGSKDCLRIGAPKRSLAVEEFLLQKCSTVFQKHSRNWFELDVLMSFFSSKRSSRVCSKHGSIWRTFRSWKICRPWRQPPCAQKIVAATASFISKVPTNDSLPLVGGFNPSETY